MRYRGVVFGWYHQRNVGDDRFAYCIERWLHDHDLIFLPHMETPSQEVLRRCDYAILGGGSIANQVYGAFKDMKKWIRAANIPVFGAGLGVSYYPELRDELRAVTQSGGYIWFRDQVSADFIGLEDSLVAPDLAWLYPHTFPASLKLVREAGLTGVNFRPWAKRQWSTEHWAKVLQQVPGNKEPWPLCFGKEHDAAILSEMLPNQKCPDEFDPTLPRRADLIVAMRFHAIIFAIQAGTPFVAVGNTKKLGCLLEQVGLTQTCVQVEEPEHFQATLEYVRAELNEKKLQEIAQSQAAKAWEAANLMKQRIETAADEKRASRQKASSKVSSRVRRRISRA